MTVTAWRVADLPKLNAFLMTMKPKSFPQSRCRYTIRVEIIMFVNRKTENQIGLSDKTGFHEMIKIVVWEK